MLAGGRPSSCRKQVNPDRNPTHIIDLGEHAQGQCLHKVNDDTVKALLRSWSQSVY